MTLKEYLNKNNIPQRYFAQDLGVSAALLSQIISGKRCAGTAIAVSIERATRGEVKAINLIHREKRRELDLLKTVNFDK